MKTLTFFCIIYIEVKIMDSLETISKVFLYLLPIFGVIVLAVLAVLLIRLLGLQIGRAHV